MRNPLPFVPAALLTAFLASACAVQDSGERLALVYGISLYDGTDESVYPNLMSADNDAVAMANLLERKGYRVKRRCSGTGTTTPQLPTRDQLLSDILAVPENTDRLIVYYSGHGYQYINSRGEAVDYMVMHGSLPVLNRGLMLDAKELLAAMEASPARSLGLILDSCYSGGFALPGDNLEFLPPSVQRDSGSSYSINEEPLVFSGFGRGLRTRVVVLSAAGADEESWELTSGGGVFTSWLLSSTAADSNRDGLVTLTEAWSWTKAHADKWNATYGSRWHFYPHLSGGSADIVLFEAD